MAVTGATVPSASFPCEASFIPREQVTSPPPPTSPSPGARPEVHFQHL